MGLPDAQHLDSVANRARVATGTTNEAGIARNPRTEPMRAKSDSVVKNAVSRPRAF